jgi:hypothetical protein
MPSPDYPFIRLGQSLAGTDFARLGLLTRSQQTRAASIAWASPVGKAVRRPLPAATTAISFNGSIVAAGQEAKTAIDRDRAVECDGESGPLFFVELKGGQLAA